MAHTEKKTAPEPDYTRGTGGGEGGDKRYRKGLHNPLQLEGGDEGAQRGR